MYTKSVCYGVPFYFFMKIDRNMLEKIGFQLEAIMNNPHLEYTFGAMFLLDSNFIVSYYLVLSAVERHYLEKSCFLFVCVNMLWESRDSFYNNTTLC